MANTVRLTDIEGLYEYILDYCNSENIPIDLRFRCFGDVNLFYNTREYISAICIEQRFNSLSSLMWYIRKTISRVYTQITDVNHVLGIYIYDYYIRGDEIVLVFGVSKVETYR